MKLTNSLTQKKENVYDKDEVISIYTCGPTVYEDLHIGNARPLILTDVIHRYLKYKNKKTKLVINITDIDDKIIDAAKHKNITTEELTSKNIKDFHLMREQLNILPPDEEPKVSEHVSDILDFVDELIVRGAAYELDGNVLFDVNKFEDVYGKLSNQNLKNLEQQELFKYAKKHALDFALWKNTDYGKTWKSKYGDGRPGWHTQCVVFIMLYLKGFATIHVGGSDLKFPHHENEIIQKYAYDQKPLAKIWIHNGYLNIFGIKMSKSLGNVFKIKDFLTTHSANSLRFLFYRNNYSAPLNLNPMIFSEAKTKLATWKTTMQKTLYKFELKNKQTPTKSKSLNQTLENNFDNDMNLPNVIAEIDELFLKNNIATKNFEKNIAEINRNCELILQCFNILGLEFNFLKISNDDKAMFYQWEKLIENKKFNEADKLREILISKNII